jgi:hypothetical protein
MKLNIPAKIIYLSPNRLKDIRPADPEWISDAAESPADIVKAQVESIREVYRLVRSELAYHKFDPNNTFLNLPKDEDGNVDHEKWHSIESHLLDHFPKEHCSAVEFACYIEEYVNSFPVNPIPVWVTVPKKKVLNLIANAFRQGLDRYHVYTFLGTYLWGEFNEESQIDNSTGRLIQTYTAQRIYDSIGVVDRKVISIWEANGVTRSAVRSRPEQKYTVLSEFFIPEESPIYTMAQSNIVVESNTLRKDTKLSFSVPEHLASKLNGYFFHYPVDATGFFNSRVPFLFDNGTLLTIPMVPGICSVVIAALFSLGELSWLLKHSRPNARSQTITTIYKHAEASMEGMEKTLIRYNRELQRIPLTHLDGRDSFRRILSGLTIQGVNVNETVLTDIDLKSKYPRKESLDDAISEREDILSHIRYTGGRLHGKYYLQTRTERTSTRYFNIQGMRSIFHEAVVPDVGHVFVYFDVVANDLSMLFNMAGDANGIGHLKSGSDPYAILAKGVWGDPKQRNRIKKFVSPYLYGAGEEKIINNARGLLKSKDLPLIKNTMGSVYPDASQWLNNVRKQGGEGKILAESNLIDKVNIPIPKVIGGTVGPAIIIQRFGAILFRAIICALAREGYKSVAFVHDSLLLQIPDDQYLDRSIYEIKTLVDSTRRSRGVKAMNIMLGSGYSWQDAEDSPELITLYD